MPLLNMLVMCRSKPPAVIAILDFNGHMVGGGKKDAELIITFFKSKVDEFDLENHLLTASDLVGQKMFGKQGKT